MTTLDAISRLLQVAQADLPTLLRIDPGQLDRLDLDAALLDGGAERMLLPLGQARAELLTLAALLQRTAERERTLRNRNISEHVINARPFDQVQDNAAETVRMLHELRTRAYGRVVILRNTKNQQVEVYRVAQANLGIPEVRVLNRLAPLARRLVSARIGDEIEQPKATLEVIGVANVERFFGNELAGHDDDFRRMELEHVELVEAALVENLARTVAERLEQLRAAMLERGRLADAEVIEARPVERGDTERLGAHFYTRTTALQESLMQRASSGLVIVIGVAGSGKTSVALGRTKVLCDRQTSDEGEDDPGFFRSETAVGFVLNGQLATYLERTCQMLALFDMKVREYRDLREELLRTRQLDVGSLERAAGVIAHPLESTMLWVRSIDRAVAEHLAQAIGDAVERPPAERDAPRKQVAKRTDAQNAALDEVWTKFAQRIAEVSAWLRRADRADATMRLHGLASRIDLARDRLAQDLEAHPAWSGPAHRELRQNVRSAVRERIVRALRLTDAYAAALRSPRLAEALDVAAVPRAEAAAAIDAAAARVGDGRLTDAAIDVLLVLAHSISIGYGGRQERDPISHLAQPSFYSQVFIDEFQDFSEVQIHLMGEQADPRRRAVTMVGDTHQQLRTIRPIDLRGCFPSISADDLTPAMLLENKRQTPVLARLSQRFREAVLRDVPDAPPTFGDAGVLPRLVRIEADELHDALEAEVVRLPRDYSVAVICASADSAQTLEREMRDRLTSRFRETRYSTHTDLVRRFFVHFTTPIDAKGLEFDATIVPWADAPDLTDPLTANGTYVAISRPRHRLSIIAPRGADEALRWVPDGFIQLVDGVEIVAGDDALPSRS